MQRRATSKNRTKEAEKEVDMEENEVTSVEEMDTDVYKRQHLHYFTELATMQLLNT